MRLTVVAAVVVIAIAVPLGIMLTRPGLKRAAPGVVAVANAGQAAPAIGLIVLFAMWMQSGFTTAVVALSLYAILPVLRNTIIGLQGVDRTLVEAGRGVGHVHGERAPPRRAPPGAAGDHGRRPHRPGAARRHRRPSPPSSTAAGWARIITAGITLYRYSVMVAGAPCSWRCWRC